MQNVLKDGLDRARAMMARLGGRGFAEVRDWLAWSCTIIGTSFAERIVERALKIQIGFLIFLALVAPFGGMGLEPILSPMLFAQAALTWFALTRVRRRDPIFGAGLYLIIAVITFIEAKGYSGMVGFVFSLEAMLSLVAAYYIVVVLRIGRAPRNAVEAAAETGEDEGTQRA